jgi:hypothetical protein
MVGHIGIMFSELKDALSVLSDYFIDLCMCFYHWVLTTRNGQEGWRTQDHP